MRSLFSSYNSTNAPFSGCCASSGFAFSHPPTAYCQKSSPGFTLGSMLIVIEDLKLCAVSDMQTKARATAKNNLLIFIITICKKNHLYIRRKV